MPSRAWRLAGRPWAQVTTEGDTITAGAGALDSMVAKASAKAGITGLEFYAGIPSKRTDTVKSRSASAADEMQ